MNKYDKALMATAHEFANMSSCRRRKVGAVIAKDTRIKSTGINGTVAGMSNTCEDALKHTLDIVIHAEMNAILFAAKEGIEVKGTTLYCTLAPCLKCAVSIAQAGIIEVVYQDVSKTSQNGLLLLEKAGVQTREFKP